MTTKTLAETNEEFVRLYGDRLKVECEAYICRNGIPQDQAEWDQLGTVAGHAVLSDHPELKAAYQNLHGVTPGSKRIINVTLPAMTIQTRQA